MALKQKNRMLSLKTPLGEDVLLLTAISGQEEMSRLFQFELDMISDNNSIQPKEIVGHDVTVGIELADNSLRYFHGFVSAFAAGDEDDEGRRNYRATLVPWLWFLTQTADCRIFQNMNIPDIIEKIFQDLGFTDFEMSEIKGSHKEWEYCVQYRETDFNFVSRLMEQEGIFYHFRFEDGKHTLVMSDQNGSCKDCPEKEVDYPRDFGTRAVENYISSWEHRYAFRPGKFAQTDYNFQTPSTSLMTGTDTLVDLPRISKYELYDYPGEYAKKSDGDVETKIRMEEQEQRHDLVEGSSFCRSFTAGGKFKLRQHRASGEQGKTYILNSVQHQALEPLGYETGPASGEHYKNEFTCTPESVAFRPARTTSKPIVQGVQTAVVTGPAGEEIYTDEFGRVKVQFHWDREGKKDENSSCWVRVSQNWAGNRWGIIFNPRIGQEVIVDFLEGDPDRPIITGRVYNAEQMPPYGLPGEQTKSAIKTRSSKGGTDDNFNEIRFEDKKGAEQLFIHAEKNQDIEVENDETHWVGHDRKKMIDNDETTMVKGNRTESVGKDETIEIKANRTENVRQNETITIDGKRSEIVAKDENISIGGNRTETVSQNEKVTVDANREVSIGKSESTSIAENMALTVGKEQAIDIGTKMTIRAGDEIVLQTGNASIVLRKDGTIQITGKDITLKGSGKITGKASQDIILKGKKINHN